MRAFVIAMECEAEAVRPAMRPGDRLYLSGVGKVNAAMAAQQAIDEGADEIINAGVAGGLDPAFSIGDVCEMSSAVEYDFDLDDINHRGVGVLDERDTARIPFSGAPDAAARVLASGDHFRNDDGDLELLSSLGCTVRDMEGAAIAHVCERRGVRCRSVKAISDVAGRGGMVDQYMVCREKALKALSETLPGMLS